MNNISIQASSLYHEKYDPNQTPSSIISKTKHVASEFFKTTVFIIVTTTLSPLFALKIFNLANFSLSADSITTLKLYIFAFKLFNDISKFPSDHLDYHIINNNLEIVKCLLKSGVKATPKTHELLGDAIRADKKALSLLLISFGINNPPAKTDRNSYPLLNDAINRSCSCSKEDLDFFKVIFKLSSLRDPDEQIFCPFSFLEQDLPSKERKVKITKLLLEAGLDPNLKTSFDSPIEKAFRADNFESFKMFLSYGADMKKTTRFSSDDPLSIRIINKACKNGDLRYLKELTKDKNNFDTDNDFLYWSVFDFLKHPRGSDLNTSKVLEEILKLGIDPNIDNKSDLLGYALYNQNIQTAKIRS